MAFALKIVAKTKNGKELEVEPDWWEIHELQKAFTFEEEMDHGYLDYYLHADKETFIKVMESQEKYKNDGEFVFDDWEEVYQKKQDELDYILEHLPEKSTIKIWIYEWESGLD